VAKALRAPIHLFDYLALEEKSEVRHEYVGGQVHAMVGASLRHNRIALNIVGLLGPRLAGVPCQVFMNDVKLHVQAADSVYYPNVLVVCGSAVAGGEKMVHDAALVVEVLSESTAEIDRREKLVAYHKLPGLRAYWIVSQEEQRVEVHERDAEGRQRATAYSSGEALPAGWLGGEPIALAQVYAGTDVAASPP
jgi:Uma2 family endonuclease